MSESMVHPRLPGRLATSLRPPETHWPVAASEVGFHNDYLTLTVDTIVAPDQGRHGRVVVRPKSAVAVAAVDEQRRILLVEQYRHAQGGRLLEIPAGIMDVEGESAQVAAARELAEETDLLADTWHELLTLAPTVGYSTERITVFRATDLRPVPDADRTVREAEEADMAQWWVDVEEAVAACFDGRIIDAKTIVAILAVART
ncbi:NUDIX domain-containing protein [Aeromicrobium sp. 636]|uniref:NUDIX hydrolase n=1 Tax=Aeromicrobium senzhongii TaxID=2663859 RepID=A0A8I0ESN2_9ACTN|nr:MULTISPECIES: NUDIX hydrolase [Aeromicrobium]MBC9224698.1 NUDIX hydrolase [Aeromicrobium senzhongii]MCQ3996811.1 NUDIX domain-containing protein [Aeromicrobium sp. 636]MTB86743.1 NUDIX domain-containing protein [Aeromicrobium senzhongii]QNL93407.1 NUDIX hydrolase [Aeromicrobium senzhongii]